MCEMLHHIGVTFISRILLVYHCKCCNLSGLAIEHFQPISVQWLEVVMEITTFF